MASTEFRQQVHVNMGYTQLTKLAIQTSSKMSNEQRNQQSITGTNHNVVLRINRKAIMKIATMRATMTTASTALMTVSTTLYTSLPFTNSSYTIATTDEITNKLRLSFAGYFV